MSNNKCLVYVFCFLVTHFGCINEKKNDSSDLETKVESSSVNPYDFIGNHHNECLSGLIAEVGPPTKNNYDEAFSFVNQYINEKINPSFNYNISEFLTQTNFKRLNKIITLDSLDNYTNIQIYFISKIFDLNRSNLPISNIKIMISSLNKEIIKSLDDSLAQPVLIISSVFEYSLDYWTFNNSSKLSKLTQEYDEDKVHADILGAVTTLADVSPYCWAMGALSFDCFFVLGFAGAVLSSWNAS